MGILDPKPPTRAELTATYAGIGSDASVPYAGIVPANFPRWRAALGRVRNGAGSAKLLCVGDSTTFGVGSGGANPALTGYPQKLAAQLNSYHAPASVTGTAFPSYFEAASSDSRYTYGTGWVKGGLGFGNGSSANGPAGTTAAFTFTPGYNVDTFDIYYIQLGSSAEARVGAGPITYLTGSGATIGKATVSVTAGTGHTLSIANVTLATAYILFIDAYVAATRQVRIANAGVGGSAASTWQTASPAYSPADMIKAYAPDLTIIMLGINDAIGGARTATQFKTDLQVVIDAAKASGDLILASVVPSSDSAGATLENAYRADIKATAAANGYGYVDILGRYGSYAAANGAGMMVDLVHPNGTGYGDIAGAFYAAVKSIA